MNIEKNYQEEYEQLKKDFDALHKRYVDARQVAIERSEMAARLASNKTMLVYRKAQVKTGKGDPFAQLRPLLTQAEAKMVCNIDHLAYRRGDVVIRGWAFDMQGVVPPLMVRDRSRILPIQENWYPRTDVNDQLSLPEEMCTGFSVRIHLKDIRHETILFEFENEFGYVAKEVKVLLKEKDRRAYLEKNAHPVYAMDSAGYDDWFHDHMVSEEELLRQSRRKLPYMPLISIVIPLFNTPERFLDELMESLLGQSYRNIEICLADGSTSPEPGRIIAEKYQSDPRVRYQKLAVNAGISGNTNEAIKMAKGEFILLSDHDDTLEKNAVYEIVYAMNRDHTIDVVYTDEDKLMYSAGVYYSPNFKPDYNPDMLYHNNYICHMLAVRRSLLMSLEFDNPAFEGAQDHHLTLQAVEIRCLQSTKMYAYENGRRAIEAHYKRVGIPARVELAEDIGSYRTVYEIQGEPLVSIIIPNKDLSDVLKRAVDSIFEKSTYRNFEIVICENNSTEPETFAYYEELQKAHDNVHVVTWEKEFNFSAINNYAVKHSKGEYLIFLNNDVEVITDRWIEEMLGYCQRSDVGACGARLYYPNDRLQHCGIVVGIGGIAGHICHLEKRSHGGYFGRIFKTQDVSAVTAACMMMPRRVFEEVGGYDEELAVAYNDVDLCLKVREKGLLVVYNAWAQLYHHESLSRGSDDVKVDKKKHDRQMNEARILKSHWPEIFEKGDPYFNPNLDYSAAEYVLAGTIPPNYSALSKREV